MILLYLSSTLTLFCFVSLLGTSSLLQRTPEAKRLLDVVDGSRVESRLPAFSEQLRGRLLRYAQTLRGKLGLTESAKLKARLTAAGLRDRATADIFFAAQFLLPLAMAFGGSFVQQNTMFWVLTGAVAGFVTPDFWLNRKINRRKTKIRRSMPDAMDLLVICVDAGLGMDQALLRVGDELVLSHPEINEEFVQVNVAQRAGQPRLEAWKALADRPAIDEFRQFVNMLTQTERFGTPIAKALSRFSEDLRTKRRQHAEQQAAKTKIKIIFPLVLCIFPCIFIVLLAPALLTISSGINGMSR